MTIQILTGDCREVLKTLADASVDSIVTDPPYHLTTGKKGGSGHASIDLESPYGRARIGTGFMGMKWDGGDVAFQVELWAECLRVLKPGGHLLAFSGTRTQHRMVCAIEDAGFEIRDQAGWMYGSGFPKSMDVSKAIDKAAGAEREVVGFDAGKARPNKEGFAKVTAAAEVSKGNASHKDNGATITAPATAAAKQWEGWGTALKPAWEPICVARKPLIGTVAANVLAHGTGALNIDGCRVEHASEDDRASATPQGRATGKSGALAGKTQNDGERAEFARPDTTLGRWPANLLHDGSPEVVALFTREAGAATAVRGTEPSAASVGRVTGERDRVPGVFHADSGTAARFFWCPKTAASDRHEGLGQVGHQFKNGSTLRDAENLGSDRKGNHHPTVKPTELMRYLCRLVTPPGGTVLDPFMGSGSTLKAAELEGFSAIGIELDPAYVEIAKRRIGADAPLFAEVQS